MIKITSMFVCEDYSTDVETGNFSAFNIFEQITPSSLPLYLNKIAVCLFLTRQDADPSTADYLIVIKNNDHVLFQQDITFSFESSLRTRATIKLHGLPVLTHGHLLAEAKRDEEIEASWSVNISVASPTLFGLGDSPQSSHT